MLKLFCKKMGSTHVWKYQHKTNLNVSTVNMYFDNNSHYDSPTTYRSSLSLEGDHLLLSDVVSHVAGVET